MDLNHKKALPNLHLKIQNKIMEAIAKTKYLKGSPRKARLVIDLIRGRNVSQALNILKFTDKRAAKPISKCLNSAIANAVYLAEQQNIAIDPDDLWIKKCFVDMGPTKHRRRLRPAPQGRAYREQRHYCHITIQVSSEKIVEETKKNKSVKTKNNGKQSQEEEVKKVARGEKSEESVVEAKETTTVETNKGTEEAVKETAEAPEAVKEEGAKMADDSEEIAKNEAETAGPVKKTASEVKKKNGEKKKA